MTTFGMIILFIILIYFLFLSIKAILIGVGKVNNPILKKKERNNQFLIRGIIGFLVSFPFFCFILFCFIMVFVL